MFQKKESQTPEALPQVRGGITLGIDLNPKTCIYGNTVP